MEAQAERQALHVAGDDPNIAALVRRSPVPVWLLSLPSGRVIEVSDAITSLMAASRDELLNRHVTDFVADVAMSRSRMGLLTSGVLDSYRVYGRTYRRPDGSEFEVDACLSACTDESPRRFAVGVLLPVLSAPHAISAGMERSGVVAMGTVGEDWRIDRISAGIEQLLGYKAATVVGQPISALVQSAEWPSLLIAIGHGLRDHFGATSRVLLRGADGESRLCTVHVTPLAGEGAPGFAFSLSVAERIAPSVADRAWELEGHMRRIAREVAASGVLAGLTGTPTATTVPAMAGLSTRELEIVSGLVAGERVHMMAERMFLSASTIRNHLTSVYRKLGVHSQPELLTLLRAGARTTAHPAPVAYGEGGDGRR